MKVALVYDRINKWGGAEKVLTHLHEIWPEAPLYTSVYDSNAAPWANIFDVRTTFLQNTILPKNKHESYPFLMGMAFETLNFKEYDVVISVTSEFCKAIITKPGTLHICYCLNPTSYLWSGYDQYFSQKSEIFKLFTSPLVKYLRWYDKIVSNRPDRYVAISKVVQQRIRQYYGQDSTVIYPAIDVLASQGLPLRVRKGFPYDEDKYFLVVSRLVPNKRVDIVIEAFNELGLPLKVVGIGREESKLKSTAKSNIEFLGSLTDGELSGYYEKCRALIEPGEVDFGLVSIEAQSFGKPVIAYKAGGSLETIIEGKTGCFFDKQEAKTLTDTIRNIDYGKFKPTDCIRNAKAFSKERFKKQFKRYVDNSVDWYRKGESGV